MLRITSGKFRNRKLDWPSKSLTRPTKEVVREAIFSSLFQKINKAIVLDLCAGSGILGFEAISRGALKVIGVDQSRQACSVIRSNAQLLKINNYELHTSDAFRFIKRKKYTRFDIVFFDPPYINHELYKKVIAFVFDNNMLNDNGVMVVEHDAKFILPLPTGVVIGKNKAFSASKVTFLSKIL